MRFDARTRRSTRAAVANAVRALATFAAVVASGTATAQDAGNDVAEGAEPVAAPNVAATSAPSAVGYAGAGPDGRTVWLWLEVDRDTDEARGLLRSAAPSAGQDTARDATPAYDLAFSGIVRSDADEPEVLRVEGMASGPSDFELRTDPTRAAPAASDAPATVVTVRTDATSWTDPSAPDPHGRAIVRVMNGGTTTAFDLPAVATRLSSATRLDDDSFEVSLDLPFFYAEPYASLDLYGRHLERANAAWREGLQQRREFPTAATGGWWLARRDEVRTLSPGLVSVLTHVSAYSGGAHPNSWIEPRTWARGSDDADAAWRRVGEVCEALAVLERPCDEARLRASVIEDLERQEAHGVTSGTVGPNAPWLLDAFTLGPAGVTFHFAPYEVGPYVQGPFDVLVRY